MKIMFFGNFPAEVDGPLTGPQRPTVSLINELSQFKNIKVYVVVPVRFRNILQKIEIVYDGKICFIHSNIKDLLCLISKIKPEIIHVSGTTYFGMISVLMARFIFGKVKTIYFLHGILPEEAKYGEKFPTFEKICQKILVKFSDINVVASEISKSIVLKHYNVNEKKIKVIPYGLDERFKSKNLLADEKIRISHELKNVNLILFVARLVPLKSLHVLIASCLKLKKFSYKIVVIGNETNYWRMLNSKFPEFMRKNVVRFDTMGPEKLRLLYAASTVLVLPSRYEPFGLVAIEAMAFKKPVIVSDRVGMKFMIASFNNGIVTPYGDVNALFCALKYLLEDKDLCIKMGENAHEISIQNSSFLNAKRFQALYYELSYKLSLSAANDL